MLARLQATRASMAVNDTEGLSPLGDEPESSAGAPPTPRPSPPPSDRTDIVPYPEVFIGLVGPIGTDHDKIVAILTHALGELNYNCKPIKFSRLLHRYSRYEHLARIKKEEERYKTHMAAGTEVRKAFKNGSALAQLALAELLDIRAELHKAAGSEDRPDLGTYPVPRQAYVFNSLKHPEEAVFLRRIFGRSFFLIATHTPREQRVFATARRIARSHFRSDPLAFRSLAEELLTIDEKQDGEKLGQNVRGTFPESDYFIVARDEKSVRESVERFLRLVFGSPFESPTVDEMSMMHAKASAMRSADLSRQVGAAIVGRDGRVIATGCNDVPKFGGGQYWGTDSNDCRDFQLGIDPNATLTDETLVEVLGRLKESPIIDNAGKLAIETMIDGVIQKGSAGIFEGSRVTNIIEFGRIIHAEMAAVTQAARFGLSVQDSTLYCTTFPCHMCARHLIASGITKVVYIEPYPKSLVRELYPDSIVVDPDAERPGFLAFVPFAGAAPRRFTDFFEKSKRKDESGKAVQWEKVKAAPSGSRLISVYTIQEKYAIQDLIKKIRDLNFDKPSTIQPDGEQNNA